MISRAYNMDCMEYMKTLPDKFFDLAVVDPPYGDAGNGDRGGRYHTDQVQPAVRQLQPPFLDSPSPDKNGGALKEQAAHGRQSTTKKSLRGMLRPKRNTLTSYSASHATRLFGAATTLDFHQQDASLYGKN